MFSVDNSDGSWSLRSLNHVEVNLKPQFLIKSGFHIVPSPSTALISIKKLKFGRRRRRRRRRRRKRFKVLVFASLKIILKFQISSFKIGCSIR